MASLNEVRLIGNLGRDPEYRANAAGHGFAVLSLATTHRWRDAKTSEVHNETEWHRVIVGGRAAETARDYLAKGRLVFVQGRIRTRKYQKDGQDHYSSEIVASNFQMLDRPAGAKPVVQEGDDDGFGEDDEWIAEFDGKA